MIVVTGATGATGRAVCDALGSAGHHVLAVGTDAGRLESVTATARYGADVADFDATRELAERIRGEHGGVDGLVHLVGGWRKGNAPGEWDWLERRLLTSLRSATLAFHDVLSASPAGRLVVIGSASAASPTWGGANYAVLKTAADAWVAAVASGWRKTGTAAAVTLVVSSLGEGGTPVAAVADAIMPLWDVAAPGLNGTHIDLR